MIPYEELVAALRSWRERNGLPIGSAEVLNHVSVPPLTGDVAAEESAGFPQDGGVEQVYDLSDDSGLIEAEVGEEVVAAQDRGAWGAEYGENAGQAPAGDDYYGADGDSAYAAEGNYPAQAEYPADDAYAAGGDYPAQAEYPADGAYPPEAELGALGERAFTQEDGFVDDQAQFDRMATLDPSRAPAHAAEETYIGQSPTFGGEPVDEDGLTAVARVPEPPPAAAEQPPEYADAAVELADDAIVGEDQLPHFGGAAPDPDEATEIHRPADYAPPANPDAVVDIAASDVLSESDADAGHKPGEE